VQAAAMVDAAMVAAALAPIDDIRATAAYRARAAATLVSRALSDLAGTAP
jgi:CO/xanthine dehydrogenase FAD-binding subunit